MRSVLLLSLFSLATACTESEREAGVRQPLSSSCDPLSTVRCHLPWPSNTFTVVDETSATGLRLAVDTEGQPVEDRYNYLNIGDGFSRITGVAVGFDGDIDASALSWDPADSLQTDSVLQVINIQPDHDWYGKRMAYRTELYQADEIDGLRTLVIGRPVEVLAPAADHALVVLSGMGNTDPTPSTVRVALGLAQPSSSLERELAAHYAPTAAAIQEAGVNLNDVVRFSEFTTRSQADTTRRMHAMIGKLGGSLDDLGLELDSVTPLAAPEIDYIVRGRLTNAPSFLDDEGYLVLDDDLLPTVVGTTNIEFRLSIPAGIDDYRVVLYGHGTGGDVSDPAFDREMAQKGIAKLNMRFDGWTGEDFVVTLLGFSTFSEGSERSTAGLMEALAGGTVLLTSLEGILGDTLSAETIDGKPNLSAGRRPDTTDVPWVGGSMGGTMGAVMISADPRLKIGVLNVPGAGWTHMIPGSLLYAMGMGEVLEKNYGSMIDVQLGLVMAQGNWDDVDGAVWAEEANAVGGAFLMQESIDDPVLPNVGTELLANALGAVQLDPSLQDIHGLEHSSEPVHSGTALTQFRVPNTGQYDVHGFAARNTPAGHAALEQMTTFLLSAWEGEPTMEHPKGCADVTEKGDCDFSGMWE
ncbi:MAG: hypothetical protein ACI9MC_001075 [Kiritimatiellia bacterium]|jgi:hypothetical protein